MAEMIREQESSTRTGRRGRALRQSSERGNGGLRPDIVLTHAYFIERTKRERRAMQPYVPLGPLYVAGYLRQHGHRVRFFDTTFEKDANGFAALLREARPPVVGIHVLETTRRNTLELLRLCREQGIPVVVGGPDASAEPRFYLENGASYAVAGEGEETMRELLERLKSGGDCNGIPGLWTQEGFGGPRPLRRDIDELPFPSRDLVDMKAYFAAWRSRHGATSMQVSVSRGCPNTCSWCAKPVFGASWRLRSPDSVAEEVQFLKMVYSPDRISFTDDLFGFDPAWVAAFRAALEARRAIVPFECVSQVELADEELMKELRAAGCFRVWYGVDSGSPKVLAHLRRNFTIDDVRRAARCAREAGMEVGYFVQLGHPAESEQDIEETRRLIRETHPDHCRVSISYPLPGTPFYREVEKDLLPLRHEFRMEDDNVLIYKSRYSQNYYDMARLLIGEESKKYSGAPLRWADRVRYGMYRLGYGLMKQGTV